MSFQVFGSSFLIDGWKFWLYFKSLSAVWLAGSPLFFLNSNLCKQEIKYEFCIGMLFSLSLAHCCWLQSLLWWTLLYKMARLENQGLKDMGCDYDNKMFLLNFTHTSCLTSSLTEDFYLLHGIFYCRCFSYENWIFCILSLGNLFLQLLVTRCLNICVSASSFTKKNKVLKFSSFVHTKYSKHIIWCFEWMSSCMFLWIDMCLFELSPFCNPIPLFL